MFQPTYIEHQGKRILRLDYGQDLSHQELLRAFVRAGQEIATAPPRSLRIVTLLHSRFNEESAEAFKRYALANRPYVLASAVVGTSFWKVVTTSLKLHGRGDVKLFADEAAALDWLALH